MKKKCILCNELFEPKKSYYDVCVDCLFYKNMILKKKNIKMVTREKRMGFYPGK